MGQRLVITVKGKNGVDLANGYYHWSGYTDSGIITTKMAINAFDESLKHAMFSESLKAIEQNGKPEKTKNTSEKSHVEILTACGMLFATGAGLEQSAEKGSKTEIETFTDMFPNVNYMTGKNRNDGLIAISEHGMEESEKWSEADVTIDIMNQTIDISSLFYSYDDDDEMPNSEDDIPEIKKDLSCIPFDEFENTTEDILSIMHAGGYQFRYRGDIVHAIA